MRLAGGLASALIGCVPSGADLPLPALDPSDFAAEVQPRYELHCAYVGCHGSPDRPLALYARGAWRQDRAETDAETDDDDDDDDADAFGEAPLRPSELAHNLDQTRAFLAGLPDPARSLLLLRPLAPDAGGSGHGGGVQFATVDDPDYRTLLRVFTEGLP